VPNGEVLRIPRRRTCSFVQLLAAGGLFRRARGEALTFPSGAAEGEGRRPLAANLAAAEGVEK
jgi:hypothetical protein